MALRPVSFQYKQGYGDNGATTQLGFVAEEAVKIDPRLVVFDSQNLPAGFNYPTYTAVLTAAIQELNLNLDSVAGTVTPAPNSATQGFVTAFISNIKSIIGNWLADASNGIAQIFTKEINTKTLCVSDDSGAKTCITKAQLDTLLATPSAGLGNANASVVNNSGAPVPTLPSPSGEVPNVSSGPASEQPTTSAAGSSSAGGVSASSGGGGNSITTPPAGTPPPQGGEVNTNSTPDSSSPPSVGGVPASSGGGGNVGVGTTDTTSSATQ